MSQEELVALFLKYGSYRPIETIEPGFGWQAEAQLQEWLQKPFKTTPIPAEGGSDA